MDTRVMKIFSNFIVLCITFLYLLILLVSLKWYPSVENKFRLILITLGDSSVWMALVRRDGRDQRPICDHYHRAPSQLHKMHLIEQPFCDCDGISHADQHMIVCCPKFIGNRENLSSAVDASGIPQPILTTPHKNGVTKPLLDIIKNSKIVI